jgi:hypothetical protein
MEAGTEKGKGGISEDSTHDKNILVSIAKLTEFEFALEGVKSDG